MMIPFNPINQMNSLSPSSKIKIKNKENDIFQLNRPFLIYYLTNQIRNHLAGKNMMMIFIVIIGRNEFK